MVFKVPPVPLPRNHVREQKGHPFTYKHQGQGSCLLQGQGLDQRGLGPRVQPYGHHPQFPLQPSSSNQVENEQTFSSFKPGRKGKENKKVRFGVGISDGGISKRKDSKVEARRVNVEKIMNVPVESVKWRPSSNLKSSYEGSVDPIFHRYRDFQDVLALEISKSIISVDETVAKAEEGFDETLDTIFVKTLDTEEYKEKIGENIGRNLEKIFNPIISKLQKDIVDMKERNQTMLEGAAHQRDQSTERIHQLNSLLSNLSISVESSKSRKKKELKKAEENSRLNQLEDTIDTSTQKAFGVEKSRTGIDEAGVEASVEAIETLEASIASETLDTLNAIDTLNSLKAMPALDEYQTYKKKKPEQVLMVSPVVPGGYREELVDWLDNYSQMTYSPDIHFSNPTYLQLTPSQTNKNTQPDNPQSNFCSLLNPQLSNQQHHPTSQLSNHYPPPPPNSSLNPPQSNVNPDPNPSQSNLNSDTIPLQLNQNLDTIPPQFNQNLETIPPEYNQNPDTMPPRFNQNTDTIPPQSKEHPDTITTESNQNLDTMPPRFNQHSDLTPLQSNKPLDPKPLQLNKHPDPNPLKSNPCPDPSHLQSFTTPNPTQFSIFTQPSISSKLFNPGSTSTPICFAAQASSDSTQSFSKHLNDSNSSVPELSKISCSFRKIVRSRKILKPTKSINQPVMNHGKTGRKFGNTYFSSSSDECDENDIASLNKEVRDKSWTHGGQKEISNGLSHFRGHVVKTPKSRIQLNLGKKKLENNCFSTSSEDSDENDHLFLDDPVKEEIVKKSKNHDHHEISKSGSYSGRDHNVQNTNPFELLDFSSSSSVELDDDWKTTALQDSSEDEVENHLPILKIQKNSSGVSEPLVNTPNSSLVSLNEDATSKQSEGMSEKGEGAGGRDGVSEKGESAGGRDGVSEKGEGAGGRDGVSGNIEIERGLIVWRKRILFNQVSRRPGGRVPVLTISSSESDTD